MADSSRTGNLSDSAPEIRATWARQALRRFEYSIKTRGKPREWRSANRLYLSQRVVDNSRHIPSRADREATDSRGWRIGITTLTESSARHAASNQKASNAVIL